MSRKKNAKMGVQDSNRTRIVLEIVGLVSTIIVAYLAYRQATDPLRLSMSATQTAVSVVRTPTIAPSQTVVPTLEPTVSSTATVTSSPTATATSTALPSSKSGFFVENGHVILLASCNCYDIVYPQELLILRLRWGAKTRELAENGANFVMYSASVNGKHIQEIEKFRKPAILVENPIMAGDPPNAWWVYWDYPLLNVNVSGSLLTYSDYNLVEATLKTSEGIDTGWSIVPAGTTKTFKLEVGYFLPR